MKVNLKGELRCFAAIVVGITLGFVVLSSKSTKPVKQTEQIQEVKKFNQSEYDFWYALTWKESIHKKNARGDYLCKQHGLNKCKCEGRVPTAFGIAQIRKLYLIDANERMGTNYTLDDCDNPRIAIKVVRAYFERYAKPGMTEHDFARLHNAGPNWRNVKSTIEYANAVMRLKESKPWS